MIDDGPRGGDPRVVLWAARNSDGFISLAIAFVSLFLLKWIPTPVFKVTQRLTPHAHPGPSRTHQFGNPVFGSLRSTVGLGLELNQFWTAEQLLYPAQTDKADPGIAFCFTPLVP